MKKEQIPPVEQRANLLDFPGYELLKRQETALKSSIKKGRRKMTMPSVNLHVIEHSLAVDKVALIRDKKTSTAELRRLIKELSIILTCEATKNLSMKRDTVDTPMEDGITVDRIKQQIVLVPILRAGLGMLDGCLKIIPDAGIGHLCIQRDEATLEAKQYYKKLPPDLSDSNVFLLDPMLATGNSAVCAIDILKEAGAKKHISFVCVIAAPEGVNQVTNHHPGVEIFTAILDRELDENGFILPGLGDAGDRLMGT